MGGEGGREGEKVLGFFILGRVNALSFLGQFISLALGPHGHSKKKGKKLTSF